MALCQVKADNPPELWAGLEPERNFGTVPGSLESRSVKGKAQRVSLSKAKGATSHHIVRSCYGEHWLQIASARALQNS